MKEKEQTPAKDYFKPIVAIILVLILMLLVKIFLDHFPKDNRSPDIISNEFANLLVVGDVKALKKLANTNAIKNIATLIPIIPPTDFNKKNLRRTLIVESESIYKTAFSLQQGKIRKEMGIFLHRTPKGWKVYRFIVMDSEAKKPAPMEKHNNKR